MLLRQVGGEACQRALSQVPGGDVRHAMSVPGLPMAGCPWCCAACDRPLGGAVSGGVGLGVRRFSDASGGRDMPGFLVTLDEGQSGRRQDGRALARCDKRDAGLPAFARGPLPRCQGQGPASRQGTTAPPVDCFAVVVPDPLARRRRAGHQSHRRSNQACECRCPPRR